MVICYNIKRGEEMKCLLDQEVSNMNRFELKKSTELKEDDIIPIVIDVMF